MTPLVVGCTVWPLEGVKAHPTLTKACLIAMCLSMTHIWVICSFTKKTVNR